MRKGLFELSVQILIALLLLIVAVSVFLFPVEKIKAATEAEPENPLEEKACISDEDCENNPDGSKCVIIYPENLEAFCGCWKNEHCMGGICGPDNKCTKIPLCSDGVDNDGDGKIDYPDGDPGCTGATDNDEFNIIGDVDGNCIVSIFDILACNDHFLEDWPPCDWDNNDVVNALDIGIINVNMDNTC